MRLRLTMAGSEVLDANPYPPYSVADQIAYERHFQMSYVAVEATGVEMRMAQAENRAPDATRGMRVEWLLFFAWRRLRAARQAGPNFEAWLELVEAYDFEADDADEAEEAEEAEDGLDPTRPVAHTAPAV